MALNKATLKSLSDKLKEVEAKEVPTDVPSEKAKKVEGDSIKSELKKVKGGK